MIEEIFSRNFIDLEFSDAGIWESADVQFAQDEELLMREALSSDAPEDFLELIGLIADHHSIEVMKREIKKFIDLIPLNGTVLDVGAGWGWHWLGLSSLRPDITVCILDMSRHSLLRAKKVLNNEVDTTFYFIQGDAQNLRFKNSVFDGYWTVQTLQHVPDFARSVREANRVLKNGAPFANYSLNVQPVFHFISKIIRRNYVIDGTSTEGFHLARASQSQKNYIEQIFQSKVGVRYSEILFKPEVGLKFMGRDGNVIGKIDSKLSGTSQISKVLARQCSYHTFKK